MRSRRQLILTVSLLALATAAQAQNMKAGLWEVQQKPQLDAKRQAQMEQAQKQMAAMPAEQRKMMEEMMAKRGVTMDFGTGGVITVKMCVSEEQAKRNEPPVASRGNCTHDTQRSGNQIHTTFRCTDPVSQGTSDVTLKPGGDGFTATTQVTHGNQTINATSEARWLSADCGGLKPLGTK